MNATLLDSISGIGPHLLSLFLSVGILGLFVMVFVNLTPYGEITLIKEGNTAAAISLSGCILGFSIPLAQAVAQSTSLIDMLVWSAVALVSQVTVYSLVRLLFKGFTNDITNNQSATAIFMSALSIAIGLLNASAMAL